ncbi:acyl carrier protein [Clostridium botulinum]|uniref:Acyl carrier protein n=1 Tax=Clostridium botulinum C/D str. DC5 TaxID=1443128 RepID=A0A0A0IEK2_CLOBO|nr:acyl carrier protein [Clostridium botulinum]KEI01955.1 acyl carrier protein [Clostridium botulinum C/D str. BKT75002]KEI10057.1 acyl carrier protein [Clostridium botulinum C/D str. BKT2873]KGM98188.1 acyl carrier protein [Clostridium botulinum D str. CCUG 7971]KGM98948.1 acyl carrier protein [Clostridium botulinum C/D str. DC5]KOC50397.1 acyl carrier protein [Clostridium botulinum]
MTFERVRKVMAEHLEMNEEEIKLESNFQDDLGVDSLDIFEIVMEIEDEFDLEIPNEDIEDVKTVQDLVKYLDSKCQ